MQQYIIKPERNVNSKLASSQAIIKEGATTLNALYNVNLIFLQEK